MDRHMDLTLYLGGTRSGKSARAEAQALRRTGPVLYVATAAAHEDDAAMQERIRRHRARRPPSWSTLECPVRLAEHIAPTLDALIAAAPSSSDPDNAPLILLDCVTLWVSNIMFSLPDPEDLLLVEDAVRQEVNALLELAGSSACSWVLVSGEIGLGGIDAGRLGRTYCDALGMANQLIAARACNVFLVVAGRLIRLEE